jgi:hypothetical protein
VVSGIDLLITTDEINIPETSGAAKHITCRNFAAPVDSDSAMNGIMKEASIAIVQMAALVPMSFFFSVNVILGFPHFQANCLFDIIT